MIERLQNHPNIKRSVAGTALLGTLAAGGVYRAQTASKPEAAAVVTQAENQRAHDENMALVRAVRANILREERLQATRNMHRIEDAIPTPYTGPLPTATPTTTTASTPTPEAAPAIPSHSPSAVEVPAVAGQYFFGTGKAAVKFAKLGAHAHEIAQLEYTIGKQSGMTIAEIGCEQSLTVMESGNDETALNSSSGAYGLPQSLPASKMASAGADWRTNPVTQLAWMDTYTERYGGLCEAWAYWQVHSSY